MYKFFSFGLKRNAGFSFRFDSCLDKEGNTFLLQQWKMCWVFVVSHVVLSVSGLKLEVLNLCRDLPMAL